MARSGFESATFRFHDLPESEADALLIPIHAAGDLVSQWDSPIKLPEVITVTCQYLS